MIGQIAGRTLGIKAINPVAPPEIMAAICPKAPIAPTITTPATGDRKTFTPVQEIATNQLTEEDLATHTTHAPLDATTPPPTAPVTLIAQATAATVALSSTIVPKLKIKVHPMHL